MRETFLFVGAIFAIILIITLILVAFSYLSPAFVGIFLGWVWVQCINSNRKSKISRANNLIKSKEQEHESLLEKLNQGNEKINLMSADNYSVLLQQARSSASHPAWNLICELEKEYQSITAKYYLKEFGDGKIDRDMREAIEGKFSHTFGLSDDFHNRFNKLLSQISDTKPEIKTKEDKIS